MGEEDERVKKRGHMYALVQGARRSQQRRAVSYTSTSSVFRVYISRRVQSRLPCGPKLLVITRNVNSKFSEHWKLRFRGMTMA
jgi:hypothetical protein